MIGNRPQFIKAAAVSGPLRDVAAEVLVHTGQHYDEALSQVFFDELGLPRPEHRLDLGGGTQHEQTARMLAALEPLLARERPALVLVYGDTNSTLAGALAAAQAGDPGRARRGRDALVRPHDARGAQPRPDRPRERPAAVLVGGAGGDPARRAGRGRRRGRRRRDGRRRALLGPACGAAHRGARAVRCRAGRVRARDRAPGGQRRRPGAAERLVALLEARAAARSCCRCTRAPPRGWTPPGCATRLARAGVILTPRSATSTSRRCCATRARVLTDSGGVQKEAYLAGRAVRHAALDDGMDGDRRRRAGTCSSTSTRTPRSPRWRARPPAARPPLYGDGRAGRARRGGAGAPHRRAGAGGGRYRSRAW